ncbi:unnamed protein product [Pedinophyceae sp. YPF-701]|nr:unnamed protein product [Pedinophyceae sp. YPF-701]
MPVSDRPPPEHNMAAELQELDLPPGVTRFLQKGMSNADALMSLSALTQVHPSLVKEGKPELVGLQGPTAVWRMWGAAAAGIHPKEDIPIAHFLCPNGHAMLAALGGPKDPVLDPGALAIDCPHEGCRERLFPSLANVVSLTAPHEDAPEAHDFFVSEGIRVINRMPHPDSQLVKSAEKVAITRTGAAKVNRVAAAGDVCAVVGHSYASVSLACESAATVCIKTLEKRKNVNQWVGCLLCPCTCVVCLGACLFSPCIAACCVAKAMKEDPEAGAKPQGKQRTVVTQRRELACLRCGMLPSQAAPSDITVDDVRAASPDKEIWKHDELAALASTPVPPDPENPNYIVVHPAIATRCIGAACRCRHMTVVPAVVVAAMRDVDGNARPAIACGACGKWLKVPKEVVDGSREEYYPNIDHAMPDSVQVEVDAIGGTIPLVKLRVQLAYKSPPTTKPDQRVTAEVPRG